MTSRLWGEEVQEKKRDKTMVTSLIDESLPRLCSIDDADLENYLTLVTTPDFPAIWAARHL